MHYRKPLLWFRLRLLFPEALKAMTYSDSPTVEFGRMPYAIRPLDNWMQWILIDDNEEYL